MIKLWIIVVLNKLRRDYKPINGQILIWSNSATATGGPATAAAAAEGENFIFSHRTYIVTIETFLCASVRWVLELKMKVRLVFTLTKNVPAGAFSWAKVPKVLNR